MLVFRSMEGEPDRLKYQSAEYAYIGFDELTSFTEAQYRYLFSRARSTCGVAPKIRAGTNPGGVGHEWVKRRWGLWLDKKHPRPAQDGAIRWFMPEGAGEVECRPEDPDGLSRTFIKSTVWDNPHLMEKDPGYIARLKALPLVERMQLLEGDWDVMAGAGNVIRREWFEIVEAVPAEAMRARYWDLAATEKEVKGSDPDFTARAKVAWHNGVYYIEEVTAVQRRWAAVKALIVQVAELDGAEVIIGVEQEPGASGKALIYEIINHPGLQGKFTVRGYAPRKDKLQRANIWASQAEVGNVKLVKGDWDMEGFLAECEMFPEGPHDDRVDAVSGAVHMLSRAGSLIDFA
jgi:predicted phage terminase large subunit-like protein